MMKSIKEIFGMKQYSDTKFVNPERQSIEQTEDYATKKVIYVKEIRADTVYSSGLTMEDNGTNGKFTSATGHDLLLGATDNVAVRFIANSIVMMKMGIGGLSLASGAGIARNGVILDVSSTTKGVSFPYMTSAQKNTLGGVPCPEGTIVYDITLHKLCIWTGAAWETFTSA